MICHSNRKQGDNVLTTLYVSSFNSTSRNLADAIIIDGQVYDVDPLFHKGNAFISTMGTGNQKKTFLNVYNSAPSNMKATQDTPLRKNNGLMMMEINSSGQVDHHVTSIEYTHPSTIANVQDFYHHDSNVYLVARVGSSPNLHLLSCPVSQVSTSCSMDTYDTGISYGFIQIDQFVQITSEIVIVDYNKKTASVYEVDGTLAIN